MCDKTTGTSSLFEATWILPVGLDTFSAGKHHSVADENDQSDADKRDQDSHDKEDPLCRCHVHFNVVVQRSARSEEASWEIVYGKVGWGTFTA